MQTAAYLASFKSFHRLFHIYISHQPTYRQVVGNMSPQGYRRRQHKAIISNIVSNIISTIFQVFQEAEFATLPFTFRYSFWKSIKASVSHQPIGEEVEIKLNERTSEELKVTSSVLLCGQGYHNEYQYIAEVEKSAIGKKCAN